ncbi:MAG: lysylphosphatidylglycerol synthase transmembrane domain-containing protein [Phycisphaerae bacterium]
MSKWLKNILGLVVLGFLLWYLVGHWEQLKSLFKLSPKQLLVMYCLWFLIAMSGASAVQRLLNALKVKTGFGDMLMLQHASLLLNYVPMKFGTVFRANYLKRHYGLAYTHFATFFLYITFLMTAVAATAGLAVLLGIYGLGEYENKILAVVFTITIIGSLSFLIVPLPLPAGKGRLSSTFRKFLTGRSQISKDRKTILEVAALLGVNFLFDAVRLWIIYSSMGENVNVAGFLMLGALSFVVLFVGLTPGSLGIREFVLGFGATIAGVPMEVGILAAMIDRAITVSYIFVAGGICAIWLWHKSPADFKEQRNNYPA